MARRDVEKLTDAQLISALRKFPRRQERTAEESREYENAVKICAANNERERKGRG